VARVAGLLAVAVLPLVAGLSGDDFFDPEAMADGFAVAMVVTAALAVAGGVVAFFTIDAEILDAEPASAGGDTPSRAATDRQCGVAGTPLRPGREADCERPADGEPQPVGAGSSAP